MEARSLLSSHLHSWGWLSEELRSYLITTFKTQKHNHSTTSETPAQEALFFPFSFLLGYSQLTNNVVIVSGEQRRDSAIHNTCVHSPPNPVASRLLHNTAEFQETHIRMQVLAVGLSNFQQSHRPSLTVGQLPKQYLNSSSA